MSVAQIEANLVKKNRSGKRCFGATIEVARRIKVAYDLALLSPLKIDR